MLWLGVACHQYLRSRHFCFPAIRLWIRPGTETSLWVVFYNEGHTWFWKKWYFLCFLLFYWELREMVPLLYRIRFYRKTKSADESTWTSCFCWFSPVTFIKHCYTAWTAQVKGTRDHKQQRGYLSKEQVGQPITDKGKEQTGSVTQEKTRGKDYKIIQEINYKAQTIAWGKHSDRAINGQPRHTRDFNVIAVATRGWVDLPLGS